MVVLAAVIYGTGCVSLRGKQTLRGTVRNATASAVEISGESTQETDPEVDTLLDNAEVSFVEGVRQYRAGNYESARARLSDAINQVISADMLDFSEFDNRLRMYAEPEEPADTVNIAAADVDPILDLPETGQIGPVTEPATSGLELKPETETAGSSVQPVADESLETEPLDEPKVTYDLPVVMNKYVAAEIKRFQRGHDAFQAAIDRSGRYLPAIKAMFRHEGLPEDLAYLSMVESYFKPKARSRVGAAGLWQFMERTGRNYGLERNLYVDERYNVEKSTYAAIAYLSYLHEMFKGDWLMALGSYNMGEGGMLLRAVLSTGTQDFWKLLEKNPPTKYLPMETRHFVPRILAAIIISKEPEKYGFRPSNQLPVPTETIPIEGYLKLATIANWCGASVDELRDLNPELRRDMTPPQDEPYPLIVPIGTRSMIEKALAKAPKVDGVRSFTYRVKRGDTLSKIAQEQGTTVEEIMAYNGLKNHIININQSLVIPVSGKTSLPIATQVAAVVNPSTGVSEQVHEVGRGDTLWEIAREYNTTVAHLLKLNNMSWSQARRLQLGQKLVVGRSSSTVLAKTSVPTQDAPASYVVQRGDSLWLIANKYGVDVKDLIRWNSLTGKTIHPGKKLIVHGDR